MLDALNNAVLGIMDFLLGWTLYLPTWAAVAVVAVVTSAILTFVRPLTTNQDMLRRCKQDKKRLKELMRESRKSRDKEARLRQRASVAVVAMKMLKAEGWPLLAAIIPIAMLCTWCFARLGYVPPRPGEQITVTAYFRVSAIGQLAHVVPEDGLRADGGWVRHVTAGGEGDEKGSSAGAEGKAVWTIRADRRDKPYTLTIRCGEDSCTKELIVDSRHYSPAIEYYPDHAIERIELDHKPYEPFGLHFAPRGDPGSGWLSVWTDAVIRWFQGLLMSLDFWLAPYLIVAVPLAFGLRWLCRIY
ncbi:MAG: hypothetical protein ACE15C_14285 [Phycisphaerae bacterium]